MGVDWMKRLGDNRCDICKCAVRTALRKRIFSNSAIAIIQVCLNSHPPHRLKSDTNFIPHETAKLLGYKIEDIPLLEGESENLYIDCVVFDCKNPGAEDHHSSPKCTFAHEADNWPRFLLCVKHHNEWHQRMLDYREDFLGLPRLKHVSEIAKETGMAEKIK